MLILSSNVCGQVWPTKLLLKKKSLPGVISEQLRKRFFLFVKVFLDSAAVVFLELRFSAECVYVLNFFFFFAGTYDFSPFICLFSSHIWMRE